MANGNAFSDIMVHTKILPTLVQFSIQFTKGSQLNPPHSAALRSGDVISCLTVSADGGWLLFLSL